MQGGYPIGDCLNIPQQRLFLLRRARSPTPNPIGDKLHSRRFQNLLDLVKSIGRYVCAPIPGFEAADSRDRDVRPLSEVLLLKAEQRAGGPYLFGFHHDKYISL